MFGDNSMEQRELPVQLEQKPVKEPELNATAFVPSVLASAFVPSMQGPSDVTAISEVSDAWQTHQMNSELHFATEALGTGHQVSDVDDAQLSQWHKDKNAAVTVLERIFSQKKEDCERAEAELACFQLELENHQTRMSSADVADSEKSKRSRVKQAKKAIRIAQIEIAKLDGRIAEDDAAQQFGDVEMRWLVVGCDWDFEKGKWRNQCGHMCKPGDSWSQALKQRRTEITNAVESARQEMQALTESSSQNQLRTAQRNGAVLKAKLKTLRREKNTIAQELKDAKKVYARLNVRNAY